MKSGLVVRKGKRIWKFLRREWKRTSYRACNRSMMSYVKLSEKRMLHGNINSTETTDDGRMHIRMIAAKNNKIHCIMWT